MMAMSLRLEWEPHASQRPVSPPRLEMAAGEGCVGELGIGHAGLANGELGIPGRAGDASGGDTL